MKFYKFPSIESFHHKVKAGKKYFIGSLECCIKPKLHGTNAGIVFHPSDGVYAQSRKRVIGLDNDNMNFAKFVDDLNVENTMVGNDVVVLYGEWAGQGIQSNDAITKIGKKIFAPFAIIHYNSDTGDAISVDLDSNSIKAFCRNMFGNNQDIVVIDTVDTIRIDFNGDHSELERVTDVLNAKVDIYEKIDTWVRDVFGVEAPGEGFVVTPITKDYDTFYNWSFKIKTEAHSANKSTKSASVYVEPSSDVKSFVKRFVTEPRLEQAIHELGGHDEMDMSRMGDFLKWMNQDIKKESVAELEESELDWKSVTKVITSASKMWFMKQYK